jgi:FkbM family methyltransferase
MSTKYFILTKEHATNNENDQIVYTNRPTTYILPQVNMDYYAKHGLFENQLIEWTKQLLTIDKIFLDIGSHTGTYAISLADLCKEVYCFEPQKMTYYALCGSVALSNKQNITCFQTGLGSENQVGIKTLNIVSNDGGGSSIHITQDILREEKIEIRTLDSYRIENIGFIKMDVEENELDVLKGAMETIIRSNYPKILFESNPTDLTRQHALFEYITNVLNYRIINIGGYSNMYLAEK